ncbi:MULTISPECIES: hypothetical protein [Streptomycetaceae]|uniref:Uncharacterized protein n=1 Tax=Streptantibioticus cattleyicolor (strain ATCC 35852 / DSM 46488 / JCM 4925 / NBRC 14057 / NRRL 8057) TaxID=1003195 RepID=F8K1C8_STREN|nr:MULTISPECIES: hypothetical protein [Streptomycetaceae]AEW96208.1 hypothetical protein SCATT_38370 [Streptantibioticus cattleyicolor NRRL 8057 = DSM 46488]MYS60728.1 hypothetical protein [Streptomyces sp. SID5468]CCB76542.1 conserved protein of unknown function [Streptantibioticus cattleyicolor NRRL 8057 = DSM 46488]
MEGVNASLVLAATPLVTLADFDKNKVTPGLLGFVIFAALGAATWFLMKSMSKQFKKVTFEEEPEPARAPAEPSSDGASSTDG